MRIEVQSNRNAAPITRTSATYGLANSNIPPTKSVAPGQQCRFVDLANIGVTTEGHARIELALNDLERLADTRFAVGAEAVKIRTSDQLEFSSRRRDTSSLSVGG